MRRRNLPTTYGFSSIRRQTFAIVPSVSVVLSTLSELSCTNLDVASLSTFSMGHKLQYFGQLLHECLLCFQVLGRIEPSTDQLSQQLRYDPFQLERVFVAALQLLHQRYHNVPRLLLTLGRRIGDCFPNFLTGTLEAFVTTVFTFLFAICVPYDLMICTNGDDGIENAVPSRKKNQNRCTLMLRPDQESQRE
uniref:Uncharacterized protein n=1 Tax=Anopheles farauti TaxID=69004 RepID=A0A182QU35_9DIPT